MKFSRTLLFALPLACLCACSTLWDATKEHVFGVEKRSLLVSRVTDAKEAQEDAQKVFKDALEEFGSVVHYDGGELERQYRRMDAAYERCAAKAESLGKSIGEVERVSRGLFKEWAAENREYGNADYRRRSEAQLASTKESCAEMIAAMRRAEAKVAPVLAVLHDQVLFLKHNLNAAALSSLAGEEAKVEADVADLIAEMNEAIAESEEFIAKMEK